MLSSLETTGDPENRGGGIFTGKVQLVADMSKSPISGFDFALTLPTAGVKPAPYKLKYTPAEVPTSFQFWLQLADHENILFAFKFVKGIPGLVLTGAARKVATDGTVSLEALPAGDPKHSPVLVSRSPEPGAALGPALLFSGTASAPASIRFTPDTDSIKGIVSLGLEPSTVVFGDSKIGFECPAVIIDDSEEAKADGNGAPTLNPPLATISADTPSWRGILMRQLDFYLPAEVPLFGGHPIHGYFAFPLDKGGIELVIESTVPSRPTRPGYSIRIECIDPAASGLSGLVPTLISATMELPLDGATADFAEGSPSGPRRDITFAAGKPVKLMATFARDPVNAADKFKIIIGIAAQGKEGIVSVVSTAMGGAKIFNTTAALATALIADKDVERNADVGDTKGVVLYGLLAAGTALSSMFTNDSRFVLHGVEIESTGHGAPVGGKIALTVDYSVAVRVMGVKVGVLSLSMSPNQPMRIRARRVRMSVDPSKSGLDMIGLDFNRAQMEIENPGAWNVEGLDSLFDVLGTRSGRGSTWIEVDLRFKLNLGPIKVSGATIRATLNTEGGSPTIDATIRGLEAGLTIPAAIEGVGQLQLLDKGFAADLRAKLLPLNVAADAGIIYAPPMIVLRLGVDLPAPIPLANSGFGLFGVGGLFGLSAEPNYGGDADPDPVLRQLQWTPDGLDKFKEARSRSTFGLNAAVGTLPDLGFSFSAKAGVLITVPDVAVRGSLNGRVLRPAAKMSDPSYPPVEGISFLGFIGIDKNALSFGLLGNVDLKPLLEVKVPLAGHFPFTKADADNWYIYLGADGYPGGSPNQGRGIGPISARVLPDILPDVGADAYVMLRGRGIEAWPHGRPLPGGSLTLNKGFVLAFGFSIQTNFGVVPIVWAELYASLDLLIGGKPLTLAGFGRAGGSLNLGPFSLGVQAQVAFMVSEANKYFWAEVTGRIELFFFDIEGTVTISFGEKPVLVLPDADLHPLDMLGAAGTRTGSLGVLTDDSYRVVSSLVEDPSEITDAMCVWPDAIISLPFAISPEIKKPLVTQFPGVNGPDAPPPLVKIGDEMLHYTWRLDRLELFDVTTEADPKTGPGIKVPGEFAARWQVPRSGGTTDISELLLFSKSDDLWINRLADGGKANPGKPLQQAAEICHRAVQATPGWAIGFLASEDRPGFRLPPDPVSQNPLVSRVEAIMHHFGLRLDGAPEPLDQIFTLEQPFSLKAASRVAWPIHQDIKHLFTGHIVTPNLQWLAGLDLRELLDSELEFSGQQINLDLSEPIVDGLMILVADRKLFEINEDFVGLKVFDDAGHSWFPPELLILPTGETAGLFRARTSTPISRVTITFPIGQPLGVVGIGGITKSALDAAAAENKAIADEAARSAKAAADGPKTDPTTNVAHKRAILEPGRLYRIDVDMVWSGKMFKQNESGQIIPIPETEGGMKTDQTFYTPKGSSPDKKISTNRQLFFKTTRKPVVPAPVKYGDKDYVRWLHTKQDVFQPEMIERYLAGYDPAQSEEFRFCDDPLFAHFRQDHVAALAKAYGFDIKVAVQRVDRPGPAYASPLLFLPDWSFGTDPLFLNEVEQLRYGYAIASSCKVPTPGATATVNPALEPEAWYDIHVLAKAIDPAFKDGKLQGVTFKTSRWRKPSDMFAGLGFTTAGEPEPAVVMIGDLLITAPSALTPAVIENDDQAFQNALNALGLEGWPITDVPRLSRLWVSASAGGWLFAGLMVESPEPIHRPGRLELYPEALTLAMGLAGTTVHFDIHRRDRSGSRLIYLTLTPFSVVTSEHMPVDESLVDDDLPHLRIIVPQLLLTAKAIQPGTNGRKDVVPILVDIIGTLTLPSVPGFAEDP
jgi:hypothetical protein